MVRYQNAGLLLALLTFAAAGAAPVGTRQQIERGYERSSKAMNLKFADGVAAVRAPNYVLVDPDGMRADLQLERSRLEHLFSTCTSLAETVTILEFGQVDATHARCKVRYITDLNLVSGKKVRKMMLDTLCLDEWSLSPQGWVIEKSRVVSQDVSKKGSGK